MNWQGNVTWRAKVGAPVKVGAVVVPRQVTMLCVGDGPHPDIRFGFRMDDDGTARCIEAHVQAKPNGRGVRTADLATFNVDTLAAVAFEAFAERVIRESGTLTEAVAGAIPKDAKWDTEAAVSRGHDPSRAELVAVARIYADAPKAPIEAVVDRLGYQRRTAARRIAAAREAGLLPPKGEPITDEARRVIADEEERLHGQPQPTQEQIRAALAARGH